MLPEPTWRTLPPTSTGTAGNKAAAATFKVYQSPHVTSCGALEAHTPLLVSRGEPRLVVS